MTTESLQHTFPEQHQAIVEALLLEGRFLLEGEAAFTVLRKQEQYYRHFFQASFGLELHCHNDYAFLQSLRENDTHSRDICIFLAVFCYELDREGRQITEELAFSTFSLEEVEKLLVQSSFLEVLEATKQLKDANARKNFFNLLNRKGIIDKLDDAHFRFTPAHKYFLEYARQLALKGERERG